MPRDAFSRFRHIRAEFRFFIHIFHLLRHDAMLLPYLLLLSDIIGYLLSFSPLTISLLLEIFFLRHARLSCHTDAAYFIDAF